MLETVFTACRTVLFNRKIKISTFKQLDLFSKFTCKTPLLNTFKSF